MGDVLSEAVICDLVGKDINHELDARCDLATSATRVSASIAQIIVSSSPYTLKANAGRFNPTALSANIYQYLAKYEMLYKQYFQNLTANDK